MNPLSPSRRNPWSRYGWLATRCLAVLMVQSGPCAEYISDRDGDWGDINTWWPEEGAETFPQAGDTAYVNHDVRIEPLTTRECAELYLGATAELILQGTLMVGAGGWWDSGGSYGRIYSTGQLLLNGNFSIIVSTMHFL